MLRPLSVVRRTAKRVKSDKRGALLPCARVAMRPSPEERRGVLREARPASRTSVGGEACFALMSDEVGNKNLLYARSASQADVQHHDVDLKQKKTGTRAEVFLALALCRTHLNCLLSRHAQYPHRSSHHMRPRLPNSESALKKPMPSSLAARGRGNKSATAAAPTQQPNGACQDQSIVEAEARFPSAVGRFEHCCGLSAALKNRAEDKAFKCRTIVC